MNPEFRARLELGDKCECPTCGRYAQVYKRKIHSTVALQLIRLYHLGGVENYVPAHRLILPGQSGVGDLSKAKYWGLIESAPNTDTSKKNSGMWRLTYAGYGFVTGAHKIPEFALVYDDAVLKFDGNLITIKDCLASGFNYEDLMSM